MRGPVDDMRAHLAGRLHHQKGFTLVELLVATALAGIVTSAIYTVSTASMRTHEQRSEAVRMEANLRAALEIMTRELRMATFPPALASGFDPASHIYLPFHLNGRNIVYRLGSGEKLQRKVDSGTFMPLAEGIDGVEFSYLLANGTVTTAPAEYEQIRGITIRLLARSALADPDFRSSASYPLASGLAWGPFSDGYRRNYLRTTVYCRNTGQ